MGGGEARVSVKPWVGVGFVQGVWGETWVPARMRSSLPRSGAPDDFQITVLHPTVSGSVLSSAARRAGPAAQSMNSNGARCALAEPPRTERCPFQAHCICRAPSTSRTLGVS